ncbi:hypothetical protein BJ138DRAFT_1154443 [Hygrophoropsis aurantiaca]|uniref:Uncharacterized protein n=1 Tax=Hygrophoropsis aurantiaca TaxID=72124 RepID=A0ACB8A9J8_9AGAM|nr:hypothetical protein BJ138DRAFT_1154443 [Hygrophoropsis aurantiaca]
MPEDFPPLKRVKDIGNTWSYHASRIDGAPPCATASMGCDYGCMPHAEVNQTSKNTKLTIEDKLDVVLDSLAQCRWTVGHFLHYLFRRHDGENRVKRNRRHAACAEKFLKGNCEYGIGHILEAWFHSPDGLLSDRRFRHLLLRR